MAIDKAALAFRVAAHIIDHNYGEDWASLINELMENPFSNPRDVRSDILLARGVRHAAAAESVKMANPTQNMPQPESGVVVSSRKLKAAS